MNRRSFATTSAKVLAGLVITPVLPAMAEMTSPKIPVTIRGEGGLFDVFIDGRESPIQSWSKVAEIGHGEYALVVTTHRSSTELKSFIDTMFKRLTNQFDLYPLKLRDGQIVRGKDMKLVSWTYVWPIDSSGYTTTFEHSI
jgi:hypothetical protein